ncbi:uncharacterized protein BCR38DRAFT_352734 [Pseudomassariella vexata]|uniref:Short chain dehydrogenase n=1 Tax=Pseudomassariella vexata TaxID=1141098 RepID=A0A1Y2DHL8_9PEZI|nr:uncharacterized protein BCR38DRAFT_352734 [Pseudomassariella vexata]ORY58747.1 hypothetical protein BCR38DRAFT_352734 [Pseudomassariella vexata]
MSLSSLKHLTKLVGARVLVMGGTSGIGFSVAEAAMQHGAHIIISGSDANKLRDALTRLRQSYVSQANGPARFLLAAYGSAADEAIRGCTCDLADPEVIESNVEGLLRFASSSGLIDHVVFTAGNAFDITPPKNATIAAVHDTMMVRSTAPIIVAKYLPQYTNMAPGGSFTITGGSTATKPQPNWSILASASAAVEGLARGLAVDLQPLRVNCVAPGVVHTEIFNRVAEERRELLLNTFKKASTTGTVGQAEDLAEAYLYCMKDKYVTGTVISSNGGRLLV